LQSQYCSNKNPNIGFFKVDDFNVWCGRCHHVGNFHQGFAQTADRVVGIDINPASIDDARINAAANGVEATFLAGEVEKRVRELTVGERPVVIVDPPRVGLHPDALAFVAELDASVLVYVACRPSSLLRDGLVLLQAGWVNTDRWAVDLFPHTGHVEVVSRWVRPAPSQSA
jgi:tRNA/tmRNA/rRNA uracil-C5-methylase (TrmA/RlmC/RlmD family)